MPRPPRDYRVALRQDIERLNKRIETLLVEREHKARMLDAMDAPIEVNLESLIGRTSSGNTPLASSSSGSVAKKSESEAPVRRRRRRGKKTAE